jgi:hypothetical protein
MRKKKDPFSKRNTDYDTFVNQLYKQVNANHAAWNIDITTVNAIALLLGKWNGYWAISKTRSTCTSKDRKNTSQARVALSKYLRRFVQVKIYRNINITDAGILACGLQPHDRSRKRNGKPQTVPNMSYKVTDAHQISAFYRQAPGADEVSRSGKPIGVESVKIVYFIGDNPPANPNEFPKTLFGKRSPMRIHFNPADAGRKVTFAACWISSNNLEGDCCAVITIRVP